MEKWPVGRHDQRVLEWSLIQLRASGEPQNMWPLSIGKSSNGQMPDADVCCSMSFPISGSGTDELNSTSLVSTLKLPKSSGSVNPCGSGLA
jgi:hypothetical protein